MADYELLRNHESEQDQRKLVANGGQSTGKTARIASLDVFRGLSVFLMMLVDYGGSLFPIIAHCPWNGIHLADFVMPFFLFVVGVSLAIVYKRTLDRLSATWKAVLRTLKLFFLGVLLQGGYLHGITSMTFGVDIEKIRWLGILQRIALGYFVASLCEIWLPRQGCRREGALCNNFWHWVVAFSLTAIHSGLLYGLYVPDWQFEVLSSTSMISPNDSYVYTVTCFVKGDLGPACNAAGMIDRQILGIDHLYKKPTYKNLKECEISYGHQALESSPAWCNAPFDPEGILSSLTAAVTCIIGLLHGHILVEYQDHKQRLCYWSIYSFSFMALGLILAFVGIPLNKSLYTISYLLVTSATSGITFCILYILVDVYGWRRSTCVLDWMGKHSLSIFMLLTSNLIVIAVQGFYWTSPENNIVHWIVAIFVDK